MANDPLANNPLAQDVPAGDGADPLMVQSTMALGENPDFRLNSTAPQPGSDVGAIDVVPRTSFAPQEQQAPEPTPMELVPRFNGVAEQPVPQAQEPTAPFKPRIPLRVAEFDDSGQQKLPDSPVTAKYAQVFDPNNDLDASIAGAMLTRYGVTTLPDYLYKHKASFDSEGFLKPMSEKDIYTLSAKIASDLTKGVKPTEERYRRQAEYARVISDKLRKQYEMARQDHMPGFVPLPRYTAEQLATDERLRTVGIEDAVKAKFGGIEKTRDIARQLGNDGKKLVVDSVMDALGVPAGDRAAARPLVEKQLDKMGAFRRPASELAPDTIRKEFVSLVDELGGPDALQTMLDASDKAADKLTAALAERLGIDTSTEEGKLREEAIRAQITDASAGRDFGPVAFYKMARADAERAALKEELQKKGLQPDSAEWQLAMSDWELKKMSAGELSPREAGNAQAVYRIGLTAWPGSQVPFEEANDAQRRSVLDIGRELLLQAERKSSAATDRITRAKKRIDAATGAVPAGVMDSFKNDVLRGAAAWWSGFTDAPQMQDAIEKTLTAETPAEAAFHAARVKDSVAGMMETLAYMAEHPTSPSAQRFLERFAKLAGENPGWTDSAKALARAAADDPAGAGRALIGMLIESVPDLVVGTIAAAFVTATGGASAVGGAVGKAVQTVGGKAAGKVASQMGSTAVGGAASMVGTVPRAKFLQGIQYLQERGVDITNPEYIRKMLRDPQEAQKAISALQDAGKYAWSYVALASILGAILGPVVHPLAGKGHVMQTIKSGNLPSAVEVAKSTGTGTATRVVEALKEAATEAGAQQAATGQVNPADVLIEAAGGGLGGEGAPRKKGKGKGKDVKDTALESQSLFSDQPHPSLAVAAGRIADSEHVARTLAAVPGTFNPPSVQVANEYFSAARKVIKDDEIAANAVAEALGAPQADGVSASVPGPIAAVAMRVARAKKINSGTNVVVRFPVVKDDSAIWAVPPDIEKAARTVRGGRDATTEIRLTGMPGANAVEVRAKYRYDVARDGTERLQFIGFQGTKGQKAGLVKNPHTVLEIAPASDKASPDPTDAPVETVIRKKREADTAVEREKRKAVDEGKAASPDAHEANVAADDAAPGMRILQAKLASAALIRDVALADAVWSGTRDRTTRRRPFKSTVQALSIDARKARKVARDAFRLVKNKAANVREAIDEVAANLFSGNFDNARRLVEQFRGDAEIIDKALPELKQAYEVRADNFKNVNAIGGLTLGDVLEAMSPGFMAGDAAYLIDTLREHGLEAELRPNDPVLGQRADAVATWGRLLEAVQRNDTNSTADAAVAARELQNILADALMQRISRLNVDTFVSTLKDAAAATSAAAPLARSFWRVIERTVLDSGGDNATYDPAVISTYIGKFIDEITTPGSEVLNQVPDGQTLQEFLASWMPRVVDDGSGPRIEGRILDYGQQGAFVQELRAHLNAAMYAFSDMETSPADEATLALDAVPDAIERALQSYIRGVFETKAAVERLGFMTRLLEAVAKVEKKLGRPLTVGTFTQPLENTPTLATTKTDAQVNPLLAPVATEDKVEFPDTALSIALDAAEAGADRQTAPLLGVADDIVENAAEITALIDEVLGIAQSMDAPAVHGLFVLGQALKEIPELHAKSAVGSDWARAMLPDGMRAMYDRYIQLIRDRGADNGTIDDVYAAIAEGASDGAWRIQREIGPALFRRAVAVLRKYLTDNPGATRNDLTRFAHKSGVAAGGEAGIAADEAMSQGPLFPADMGDAEGDFLTVDDVADTLDIGDGPVFRTASKQDPAKPSYERPVREVPPPKPTKPEQLASKKAVAAAAGERQATTAVEAAESVLQAYEPLVRKAGMRSVQVINFSDISWIADADQKDVMEFLRDLFTDEANGVNPPSDDTLYATAGVLMSNIGDMTAKSGFAATMPGGYMLVGVADDLSPAEAAQTMRHEMAHMLVIRALEKSASGPVAGRLVEAWRNHVLRQVGDDWNVLRYIYTANYQSDFVEAGQDPEQTPALMQALRDDLRKTLESVEVKFPDSFVTARQNDAVSQLLSQIGLDASMHPAEWLATVVSEAMARGDLEVLLGKDASGPIGSFVRNAVRLLRAWFKALPEWLGFRVSNDYDAAALVRDLLAGARGEWHGSAFVFMSRSQLQTGATPNRRLLEQSLADVAERAGVALKVITTPEELDAAPLHARARSVYLHPADKKSGAWTLYVNGFMADTGSLIRMARATIAADIGLHAVFGRQFGRFVSMLGAGKATIGHMPGLSSKRTDALRQRAIQELKAEAGDTGIEPTAAEIGRRMLAILAREADTDYAPVLKGLSRTLSSGGLTVPTAELVSILKSARDLNESFEREAMGHVMRTQDPMRDDGVPALDALMFGRENRITYTRRATARGALDTIRVATFGDDLPIMALQRYGEQHGLDDLSRAARELVRSVERAKAKISLRLSRQKARMERMLDSINEAARMLGGEVGKDRDKVIRDIMTWIVNKHAEERNIMHALLYGPLGEERLEDARRRLLAENDARVRDVLLKMAQKDEPWATSMAKIRTIRSELRDALTELAMGGGIVEETPVGKYLRESAAHTLAGTVSDARWADIAGVSIGRARKLREETSAAYGHRLEEVLVSTGVLDRIRDVAGMIEHNLATAGLLGMRGLLQKTRYNYDLFIPFIPVDRIPLEDHAAARIPGVTGKLRSLKAKVQARVGQMHNMFTDRALAPLNEYVAHKKLKGQPIFDVGKVFDNAWRASVQGAVINDTNRRLLQLTEAVLANGIGFTPKVDEEGNIRKDDPNAPLAVVAEGLDPLVTNSETGETSVNTVLANLKPNQYIVANKDGRVSVIEVRDPDILRYLEARFNDPNLAAVTLGKWTKFRAGLMTKYNPTFTLFSGPVKDATEAIAHVVASEEVLKAEDAARIASRVAKLAPHLHTFFQSNEATRQRILAEARLDKNHPLHNFAVRWDRGEIQFFVEQFDTLANTPIVTDIAEGAGLDGKKQTSLFRETIAAVADNSVLSAAVRRLEGIADASEQMVRQAVYDILYERLRESGMNIAEARRHADDVVTNLLNYNKQSAVGRWLAPFIPFAQITLNSARATLGRFLWKDGKPPVKTVLDNQRRVVEVIDWGEAVRNVNWQAAAYMTAAGFASGVIETYFMDNIASAIFNDDELERKRKEILAKINAERSRAKPRPSVMAQLRRELASVDTALSFSQMTDPYRFLTRLNIPLSGSGDTASIPLAYGMPALFFGLGRAVALVYEGRDIDEVATAYAQQQTMNFVPLGVGGGSNTSLGETAVIGLVPEAFSFLWTVMTGRTPDGFVIDPGAQEGPTAVRSGAAAFRFRDNMAFRDAMLEGASLLGGDAGVNHNFVSWIMEYTGGFFGRSIVEFLDATYNKLSGMDTRPVPAQLLDGMGLVYDRPLATAPVRTFYNVAGDSAFTRLRTRGALMTPGRSEAEKRAKRQTFEQWRRSRESAWLATYNSVVGRVSRTEGELKSELVGWWRLYRQGEIDRATLMAHVQELKRARDRTYLASALILQGVLDDMRRQGY